MIGRYFVDCCILSTCLPTVRNLRPRQCFARSSRYNPFPLLLATVQCRDSKSINSLLFHKLCCQVVKAARVLHDVSKDFRQLGAFLLKDESPERCAPPQKSPQTILWRYVAFFFMFLEACHLHEMRA